MTVAETSVALDRILAGVPDVREHLGAADRAAQRAVSPELHELARLRVAQLLGTPGEEPTGAVPPDKVDALRRWPDSPHYTDTDRAVLAFVEQFVIDVASLDDDLAAAVVQRLGAEGFADLVTALLVIEQRQRLRLVWDRLFPEAERP